jgi:polysaccharide pyruvyl transferase WcaK-like protein
MIPEEPSPRLAAFLSARCPEDVFVAQMEALIERRRAAPPGPGAAGRTPSLLLLGYNGAGNGGADARVHEIVRQIARIAGDQVRLSVALVADAKPDGLFDQAVPEPLSEYAVDHLEAASLRYDGVIVCEGSMFKSEHADMLCGMLAGALGVWDASGRLAVGYGGDAGAMSPRLERLVAGLGQGPTILCRTPRSRAQLTALGLRAEAGADTAWSFDPAPRDAAQARLDAFGIHGDRPLLAVCPINPFWWPVRPDLARAEALQQRGEHADLHYASVFFHADDDGRRAAYAAYLAALAAAVEDWRARRGGNVLLVGMERLDRRATRDLAALLSFPAPCLVSGDAPLRTIVAVLREADLLVTSRYHAIVLTMPAGVPAVGVSMDSRIADLLGGAGQGDLVIPVRDPALLKRLRGAMADAEARREASARRAADEVAAQLREMASMGRALFATMRRHFPWLRGPAPDAADEAFLPPLSPPLRALLDRRAGGLPA